MSGQPCALLGDKNTSPQDKIGEIILTKVQPEEIGPILRGWYFYHLSNDEVELHGLRARHYGVMPVRMLAN